MSSRTSAGFASAVSLNLAGRGGTPELHKRQRLLVSGFPPAFESGVPTGMTGSVYLLKSVNRLQKLLSKFFENRLKRLNLHTSQVAHQAGIYPGFHSMNLLGISLLLPGWDASP